jgi:hypothetical protein
MTDATIYRELVGLEFRRLRDLGMSKRVARDVLEGRLPEAEGLRIKTYDGQVSEAAKVKVRSGVNPPPNLVPDPNSKRSLKKARRERLFQAGATIFDLEEMDFPDDSKSKETWLWLVAVVGVHIAKRAVQKAASIDQFETSDEVMDAAKVIAQTWIDRNLCPTKGGGIGRL